MHKRNIFAQLQKNFLFAVIRGTNDQEGIKIAEAVYRGGIKNIEVTFSTPNADQVISHLSNSLTDSEVMVGAGTVLDEVSARLAILRGAKFIVSPNLNLAIARLCNLYAIPYLPGCGSISEIEEAMKAGCEVVKLFPGGLLGASFIKDLHGPMPWVEAMPSGGVALDNMANWIEKGAWSVGIGSALTKNFDGEDYTSVTQIAGQFVKKLKELQ